jgi:hypothetical protein
MADEPENLTLKLLREMRAEMREGFAELRGQIVEMKAEIVDMQAGDQRRDIAIAAISADLKITKELLERVHETQQNQGARLNVIDGRLAIIEKHTGLVKA